MTAGNGAAPVDLTADARAAQAPLTFTLDLDEAVEILTIGEVIDAASAADLSLDMIRAGRLPDDLGDQYRFLRAIAWVLRRRADPAVTWADAQSWNVIPEGATDPLGVGPAQPTSS